MDYSFCFTNIPDPDIVISVLISANVIYFVVELPWKYVSEMNWSLPLPYVHIPKDHSGRKFRHCTMPLNMSVELLIVVNVLTMEAPLEFYR